MAYDVPRIGQWGPVTGRARSPPWESPPNPAANPVGPGMRNPATPRTPRNGTTSSTSQPSTTCWTRWMRRPSQLHLTRRLRPRWAPTRAAGTGPREAHRHRAGRGRPAARHRGPRPSPVFLTQRSMRPNQKWLDSVPAAPCRGAQGELMVVAEDSGQPVREAALAQPPEGSAAGISDRTSCRCSCRPSAGRRHRRHRGTGQHTTSCIRPGPNAADANVGPEA